MSIRFPWEYVRLLMLFSWFLFEKHPFVVINVDAQNNRPSEDKTIFNFVGSRTCGVYSVLCNAGNTLLLTN